MHRNQARSSEYIAHSYMAQRAALWTQPTRIQRTPAPRPYGSLASRVIGIIGMVGVYVVVHFGA